ncbi:hypothetical protein ACQCX2_00445 [Propionibacteriaceae bacterium Y1700]|uniref:hypothetical protein n=1 Tax=Microlunatus sp. Y1700 TaxID=3418487 RepID=UPI003DA75828
MNGLWESVFDDATLLLETMPERALAADVEHRKQWYAETIGPLVVRDDQLVAVDRAAENLGVGPIPVQVINTTGAGGLVALAGRTVDNLTVTAVESALRDLDDLPGNAARVVAAARELPAEVEVFVEFPAHRGWEAAVEVVEAEGLFGMIRIDGPSDNRTGVLDQLQTLVEADLPFKIAGTAQPFPYGILQLLNALLAVIDDADPQIVSDLLDTNTDTDTNALAASVAAWSDLESGKVRRRLRGIGCTDIASVVTELERHSLLHR